MENTNQPNLLDSALLISGFTLFQYSVGDHEMNIKPDEDEVFLIFFCNPHVNIENILIYILLPWPYIPGNLNLFYPFSGAARHLSDGLIGEVLPQSLSHWRGVQGGLPSGKLTLCYGKSPSKYSK